MTRRRWGLVAAAFCGGCVSVLGIGEDDLEHIDTVTCEHFEKVCDETGQYPSELVWVDRTCVDVVIDATNYGTTTATDLGECLTIEDSCLELMSCFQEQGLFQYLEQPACKASGERCLDICFAPDCDAPDRCCTTPCRNGVCE